MLYSLFTEDEIFKIRNTSFHDVLVAVTDALDNTTQKNVFQWTKGEILVFCPERLFPVMNHFIIAAIEVVEATVCLPLLDGFFWQPLYSSFPKISPG